MTNLALLGLLLTGFATPAAPTFDESPGSSTDLGDLLVPPVADAIEVDELAALLLEEDLRTVRSWLEQLEHARHDAARPPQERAALMRLHERAQRVPTSIAALLRLGEEHAFDRQKTLAVGIEVLRTGAEPSDVRRLEVLLRAASGMNEMDASKAPDALRRCLQEFTSRHVYAIADLASLYVHCPRSLIPAVLDGVAGASDSRFAAAALARLLRLVPEEDPTVLNRLHLALQGLPPGASPRIAEAIAPFLRAREPFARREAAVCLGRTGERLHVTLLIESLGDDHELVRTAAQEALRQLTGMTLPPDVTRWRRWLDQQVHWWESRGHSRLSTLADVDRSAQLEILREVCTKRLYHEEVAEHLKGLLLDGDLDERCLALSALGTLRSPSTFELVQSYQHATSPRVAEAARAALRSYGQAWAKLSGTTSSRTR